LAAENLPAPILFHSRFLARDRSRIEDRVMAVGGKRADPRSRHGQLVIATQVAEQSLDLDFDTLASDLAPVDALIPRLGRWRRHKRLEDGKLRTDEGGDLRSADEVLFLAPSLKVGGSNWLASVLPRAVNIYPDQARMWLTAQVLLDPAQIAGRA